MYPQLDGLVLNGDIVDQGLDEQYETVSNFFVSNAPIVPANIIYNIGNHEFYDYKKGVNSSYDNQVFIKRFLEFSNQKNVYHDTWINGYHFISLGSEKTHTLEQGPVDAYISRDQMEWLKAKLQDGYTPGKPIFVFLHQPIGGAPIGGKYNSGSVIQDSELSSILSQYPESILFSSHTHAVLNFDKVIDDNQFKKVHTGAVHNPLSTGGSVKGSSQGIIVEVLNDKVKIKGRDFKKGEWIGETDIFMQPLNHEAPKAMNEFWEHLGQSAPLIRYLLYSILVTLLDIAIAWILYRPIHMNILIANTAGVVAGFIVHYLLASKTEFDTEYGVSGFTIYLGTFVLGLAMADGLIYLGRYYLFSALQIDISFFLSKGLSIVIPFFSLYYLRKLLFGLFKKVNVKRNGD
jgi:putative flippase GtrA